MSDNSDLLRLQHTPGKNYAIGLQGMSLLSQILDLFRGWYLVGFVELHDPLAYTKVIWNNRIKNYYRGGLRLEEDV